MGGTAFQVDAFQSDAFQVAETNSVSGITRDRAGVPIGFCTVKLFDTATDTKVAEGVSGADGAYALTPSSGSTFYLVAYKAGSPDVAGTTVDTLTAS